MIFQDVLIRKPGRSLFNLSHERKFSCDWSGLYPFLFTEAVPGDTWKIATEALIRTAPLRSPVMHRINVKFYYFFVPNRLIFSKWEDFITGVDQKKAYVTSEGYFVNPVLPFYDFSSSHAAGNVNFLKDGSLADFLGFPTFRDGNTVDGTVRVPMMPFAAYQKVYDDWFRNQNVEEPHIPEPLLTGQIGSDQAFELFSLRKKCWEKDYFTSALPFAQRGDAVDIPFNVTGFKLKNKQIGASPTRIAPLDPETEINDNEFVNVNSNYEAYANLGTRATTNIVTPNDDAGNIPLQIDVTGHTEVSAEGVQKGTINDLRIATRLQRWLEKNARVGGRYIEQILGHFGVRSSDARLQRAEFLGSFTAPLVIEPVEQTSASEWEDDSTISTATPQGTLAGKAMSYANNKAIKCYCEEHGFIIGLMCILPRTCYQDQLSKMWQRSNRYDYYFPEFAHLGEQDVNKAEVFFDISDSTKRSVDRFGFQERYCEYKYIPSSVHGEFKGNLHFWHLGRQFSGQPALNKSFVQSTPNTDIFAVESGADHFYVNVLNNIQALRPMPKQAIPTL